MNRNDKTCCNCTNKALLDMLDGCPQIVEVLQAYNRSPLADAYDAILPKYKMDWCVYPNYKGNSTIVVSWNYNYTIDGIKIERKDDKGYKTTAEAQLEAVHNTKYELRKRIDNGA